MESVVTLNSIANRRREAASIPALAWIGRVVLVPADALAAGLSSPGGAPSHKSSTGPVVDEEEVASIPSAVWDRFSKANGPAGSISSVKTWAGRC